MYAVYAAEHRIDGCVYVGKTNCLERRKRQHVKDVKRGSTSYFHNALRLHGEEAFEWHIVRWYDTEAEAFHAEEDLVRWLRDAGVRLYNLTAGGDGLRDFTHTAQTRKRLSEYWKGRPRPNRRGVSINHHPKPPDLTSEHIEAMKAGLRRWREETNALPPMTGKRHSEETKQKMREAALRRFR